MTHNEPEDVELTTQAQFIATRRRAHWDAIDEDGRYTNNLDDPSRYEIGTSGRRDVLGPAPERYVLIEQSRHRNSYWISTFATRAEAGIYRDTDEASDDWLVEQLIDLDTGRRYQARRMTKFAPMPSTDA